MEVTTVGTESSRNATKIRCVCYTGVSRKPLDVSPLARFPALFRRWTLDILWLGLCACILSHHLSPLPLFPRSYRNTSLVKLCRYLLMSDGQIRLCYGLVPWWLFSRSFCPDECLSTLLSASIVFSFGLVFPNCFYHVVRSHLLISVFCSHVFLPDLNPTFYLIFHGC